jgi:hypothetical protein
MVFSVIPAIAKTPNNPEKRPAEGASKYTKGQRGVGAGDKNKDRGMLDDSKTAFDLAYWPCMVERGCKVKKNHGHRENTRTDNESGIPLPYENVPYCLHIRPCAASYRADSFC